jgi:hypothetical protein
MFKKPVLGFGHSLFPPIFLHSVFTPNKSFAHPEPFMKQIWFTDKCHTGNFGCCWLCVTFRCISLELTLIGQKVAAVNQTRRQNIATWSNNVQSRFPVMSVSSLQHASVASSLMVVFYYLLLCYLSSWGETLFDVRRSISVFMSFTAPT